MLATRMIKKEVMGYVLGYPRPHEFIVLDSFAIPAENTETRANVGDDLIVTTYVANYIRLNQDKVYSDFIVLFMYTKRST
jgi:hypothetical protein